jgi:predicted Ser/Thr protein kinase
MEIGAPLRPSDPTSLGRYEVLRRLGQGGMGTVYLARGERGRLVALKVVKPVFTEDPQFTARFRHEAAAASRVPAFCTARVLDVDADADPPFLVTEFISGPSLDEAVRTNGPLPPSDLEGLAVGMAAALSAIHAADVIHRDLKPSNVLLSPVGPRVIDFGVARALDFTTTRRSQIVGTPAFMAPEQIRGTGVGPAADIFAWGGVLVFASTGEPPFGTSNPAALMFRIIDDEPDLRGLDGDLRQLVRRAMRKDPADRPTSRELLDLLVGGSTRNGPSPASAVLGNADHVVPLAPPRRQANATPTAPLDWTTPVRDRRQARSVPWLTVALAVVAAAAMGLLVREWLLSDTAGGGQAVNAGDRAGASEPAANAGQPGDITVGGAPVTVDAPNGEDARLQFAGEEGQRLNIGVTDSTMSSATVTVLAPDGETLDDVSVYETVDDQIYDIDLDPELAETGEHTIVVDPHATGSATVTLSPAQTHDIAVGGDPVNLTFRRPGQDARLRFSADEGQRLSVVATDVSLESATMRIVGPNATTIERTTISATTGSDIEDLNLDEPLSESGTYTIVVDPDVASGAVTVAVSST